MPSRVAMPSTDVLPQPEDLSLDRDNCPCSRLRPCFREARARWRSWACYHVARAWYRVRQALRLGT